MSTSFDTPFEEHRPWGKYDRYTLNEPSTVKILMINAGEAFSLQHHHHREEFWVIMSGNGTVEIGNNIEPLMVGAHYIVPRETNHRITAGTENVKLVEISIGDFDEKDIVHIEDRYGRL